MGAQQDLDYKKTTKSNPPLVLLDLTNEETTSIELKNTRASGSTRPICIEISDDESD
jgi:hypothetical protein